LQENPPFDVHPDVKELFEYFEENFWPEWFFRDPHKIKCIKVNYSI
jgi:hypothetical protein